MKILKGELTDHPRGDISAQKKKAIVIGATGATGTKLVRLLIDSDNWDKVTTISRRSVLNGEKHNKLNEVIIDSFDKPRFEWFGFNTIHCFLFCHLISQGVNIAYYNKGKGSPCLYYSLKNLFCLRCFMPAVLFYFNSSFF